MNKSQLTEKLESKLKLHPQIAKRAVDLFFDRIKQALSEGDKTEIRNFGIWKLKEYDGYDGRNPKTGEEVEVQPRKLPVFKPGKELKKRVELKGSLKN